MKRFGVGVLVVALNIAKPASAIVLDTSPLSLTAIIHTRGEYDNFGLGLFNGAPLSPANQPTFDEDQLSADWSFYLDPQRANALFITASNVFDTTFSYLNGPPFAHVALTGFSFTLPSITGGLLNAVSFSNALAVPGETLVGPNSNSTPLSTTPGWGFTASIQSAIVFGTPIVDDGLTHFPAVTDTTRILGGAAFELTFDPTIDLAKDANFGTLNAQGEFGLGLYNAPGTLTYVAFQQVDMPEPSSLLTAATWLFLSCLASVTVVEPSLLLRGHFGIRVERLTMGVGWPGQM